MNTAAIRPIDHHGAFSKKRMHLRPMVSERQKKLDLSVSIGGVENSVDWIDAIMNSAEKSDAFEEDLSSLITLR